MPVLLPGTMSHLLSPPSSSIAATDRQNPSVCLLLAPHHHWAGVSQRSTARNYLGGLQTTHIPGATARQAVSFNASVAEGKNLYFSMLPRLLKFKHCPPPPAHPKQLWAKVRARDDFLAPVPITQGRMGFPSRDAGYCLQEVAGWVGKETRVNQLT